MADPNNLKIEKLNAQRRGTQAQYFAHRDPGNLTPTEKQAFQYRDMAYLLLFKAAQIELDAETELQALLAEERFDARIAKDEQSGALDTVLAPSVEDFASGRFTEMK